MFRPTASLNRKPVPRPALRRERHAIRGSIMPKNIDFYTRKNIASWDEAAPVHASINASVREQVANPDFNNLNPDFDALVDVYGVRDKSVVQVCCNNGIDLLSVKNKGAGRCLGIDGSGAFIEQASALAASAGHADIEFCHSDIYTLPQGYLAQFDVLITTVGVVSWMPDIDRFMRICSSLLAPGGIFLMEELHPVIWMYEEGEPSFLKYSYFETEPVRDTGGLDYFTHEKYDARENYSFQHTLADIFMAAIASRLQLEHVRELGYNVGNYCADLESAEANPPLAINCVWRKLD
jgi:2-polyprenyl-3-methyl-5-hydroxy-6-metoxy-1,4-benzoquinol methylase